MADNQTAQNEANTESLVVKDFYISQHNNLSYVLKEVRDGVAVMERTELVPVEWVAMNWRHVKGI